GGVNFTPAWWASNLISAPSGTFKPLLSEGQQRYNNIEDGTWSGSHWLSGMQKNNAQIQSHSITIAGGSQYSTYSLGFSYLDQDGIMGSPVESHYTRYTFRINSDHVLWHENFDILKFGENLQF